jgi:ferredoxin
MSCGRVGCRKCIEICPSGALFSQQGRVVRRDALCRSCTACLLACPTGSASSLHPERDAPLEPLDARLQGSLASGYLPPWLILSFGDPPAFQEETAQPASLCFSMHRWAMAGLELWLAALALGAAGVAIHPGGDTSASVRRELERQHCLATHILRSLGLGEERIRLEKSPASLPLLGPPLPDTAPLSLPAASGASKRELLFKSLQQLQAGSSRSQEAVGLPWDAGFGTVRLDSERCTLCQACVTVCPTGALRAETGGSHSQLLFRELDCIQCGLCREACPEAALELQPRLLLRDEALCFRRICEQELASCPECGRPVAPASLLGSIRQKLRNHRMHREDPAGKQIFLCADCKARTALEE